MIRFALRFPEDLHTRVRAQAIADRRSINSEILHLIEIGLDADPEGAESSGGNSTSPASFHGKPEPSPAWEPGYPPAIR
ncbi:Arc family DNA-binding protein [Streptomyces boncukensis]|nr:Arc family DNA-binding protein [Streptomyces boncukensis]